MLLLYASGPTEGAPRVGTKSNRPQAKDRNTLGGPKDADERPFLEVPYYQDHLYPERKDQARRTADLLGISLLRP
jgi:hypothetical protein